MSTGRGLFMHTVRDVRAEDPLSFLATAGNVCEEI